MDCAICFSSPLGHLLLSASEKGIYRIEVRAEGCSIQPPPPNWLAQAAQTIAAYLDGQRVDLTSIPVDLDGLPPFHVRVYQALRRTRPGQTLTYGDLALLAGSPGAARAVGQAMRRNPIPILVPCHRVVAANGPGGFSMLGGMAAKERLLRLDSSY